SASALRPVADSSVSAARARSGERSNEAWAPSASAIMTDTECATTSCISRAMRDRSAARASWTWWSRSRARAAARAMRAARGAGRLALGVAVAGEGRGACDEVGGVLAAVADAAADRDRREADDDDRRRPRRTLVRREDLAVGRHDRARGVGRAEQPHRRDRDR